MLNTASNFTCTGILGYLIFGETISYKWVLGSVMVIVGASLIAFSQSNPLDKKNLLDK